MALQIDTANEVRRLRPTANGENFRGRDTRISPYGDRTNYQLPRTALADEGSYYTCTNPTIDTTVAYGVLAAFATTTPMFLISNTDPVGGRSIFLDYIKLRVTIAPASATNWKYVVEMDNSIRTSTAPTGGVSRTILNTNPLVSNDFAGTVWAFTGGTVLTVMAAANARIIAHGALAQSIPIVLDELVLQFGRDDSATVSVTTVGRRLASAPPVVIPPGCSCAIHQYGLSNAITGMSAEYSIGMWQR